MIRAFIAIDVPASVQHALADIRQAFQELTLPLRWVQPTQLHLTLKFLGDISEAQIPDITRAMQRVAVEHAPFHIPVRGLGCFPTPTRPRVLWMGLVDTHQALTSLQQHLDTALGEQGIPCESKPFHPHLTLARIRKPSRSPQLQALLRTYQTQDFGDVPVHVLLFMQSQLYRTGAVHTLLRSVPLQAMKAP
jgi:2'-5' RNA ligase